MSDNSPYESQQSEDGGHDGSRAATRLEQLLDQVDRAAGGQPNVSVGDVMEAIGTQSFAPILLLAGLIMLAPVIGDIPGVPVFAGLVVILVCGQAMVRRDSLWLPRWLSERSVSQDKVARTVRFLRKPGRFMDRWSKERWTGLVNQAGAYVAAATCIVIAAATPIMEVIPFSANFAGAAITAFGLALVRRDGLIALAAMVFSLTTAGLLMSQLL